MASDRRFEGKADPSLTRTLSSRSLAKLSSRELFYVVCVVNVILVSFVDRGIIAGEGKIYGVAKWGGA